MKNTIKIRKSEDGSKSRIVEGTAIVFNSPSSPIGGEYIEYIMPSAVTEELIKSSDIFCYLDHNKDRGVLARSRYGEGSLSLSIEKDGLHYSFEAPHTQLGDELLNYIERGEICTSSFGFRLPVDGSGAEWSRNEKNELICHVTKIAELTDVSPVFEPAYLASDCHIRNKLENIKKIDEKLDVIKNEFEFL